MADVNASPSREAGSEETGQRTRVADAIRKTVTVENETDTSAIERLKER